MNKRLLNYLGAKQALMKLFRCDEDYDVRVCESHSWRLDLDDGVCFLSYWQGDAPEAKAVVARKDGAPLVFKAEDMTMVVAIDCIKIAFILNNNGEEPGI